MRLINLMNILTQNPKERKKVMMEIQIDVLKEDRKFLMVLIAKYFYQESKHKKKELKK